MEGSEQNPFLSTNSVPIQITPPFHAVGSHIAINYNKAGLLLLVSTEMEPTYGNVTVDQSKTRALMGLSGLLTNWIKIPEKTDFERHSPRKKEFQSCYMYL